MKVRLPQPPIHGFGHRLKEARTRKNIKQWYLSELTGISDNALSNYENDRNLPEIWKLITLCEVLDVDADWLLFGKGEVSSRDEELSHWKHIVDTLYHRHIIDSAQRQTIYENMLEYQLNLKERREFEKNGTVS